METLILLTVLTVVNIGKSKKLIPYTFLVPDFLRIENDLLILKQDKRRLKISLFEIKELLIQINKL